jgi:uncharacterized protein with von Willebrand factor type A (vWA) domain
LICDISGSMDRYARLLLQFVHALEHGLDSVEVFVFGTRLTRITRELRKRNVDAAIEHVVKSVDDWSGGTRIGESLHAFNQRWSRRVLGQNAIVLLISDGLDADAGAGLAIEMERLAKSARRVIWLNPLLRYADFEARPAGIRAMLPWVDDFRPVHNLASLEALAEALAGEPGLARGTATRAFTRRAPGSRRFVRSPRPARDDDMLSPARMRRGRPAVA